MSDEVMQMANTLGSGVRTLIPCLANQLTARVQSGALLAVDSASKVQACHYPSKDRPAGKPELSEKQLVRGQHMQ